MKINNLQSGMYCLLVGLAQVKTYNKCPEASRIPFILLPGCGPAEGLRDPVELHLNSLPLATVSSACTKDAKERFLFLFFASFKYFYRFQYQKVKNADALRWHTQNS